VRALVERIVDRTSDMAASVVNHALAEEGELVRGRLDEIAAPTRVIHGRSDPLFPYGHAEALAREIPHAELLPLEGVGHQMPPRAWWSSVIPAMLRHTSGGWEAQGDWLASRSIAAGDPTGWFDRLGRGSFPMALCRVHANVRVSSFLAVCVEGPDGAHAEIVQACGRDRGWGADQGVADPGAGPRRANPGPDGRLASGQPDRGAELADYATPAERGDLEKTLDRYPYGTTHELRDILARQSMADDIRIRNWSGTQGWRG
jgi:hypothetical protein